MWTDIKRAWRAWLADVSQPSDFFGTPHVAAMSQISHFAVAAYVLTAASDAVDALIGARPEWLLAGAMALGYAAWELRHYRMGATAEDCVADFAFVAAGLALALGAPLHWTVAAVGVGLVWVIYRATPRPQDGGSL